MLLQLSRAAYENRSRKSSRVVAISRKVLLPSKRCLECCCSCQELLQLSRAIEVAQYCWNRRELLHVKNRRNCQKPLKSPTAAAIAKLAANCQELPRSSRLLKSSCAAAVIQSCDNLKASQVVEVVKRSLLLLSGAAAIVKSCYDRLKLLQSSRAAAIVKNTCHRQALLQS